MTEQLQAAVLHLTETYRPLAAVAAGYANLDGAEIAKALADAKPDTAEYQALQALAAVNPAPVKAAKLKIVADADSTAEQ